MSTPDAKTLFERCAETSQADVGRSLNLDRARISRFCNGATDIDSEVIALCKERWGDLFDEERTLADWYARRVEFLAKNKPTPPEPTPSTSVQR